MADNFILVKVPLKKSYEIPHICCSCGKPAGNRRRKVGFSGMAGSKKYSIVLELPMCEEYEQKAHSMAITGLVGGVSGLILLPLLIYLINRSFGVDLSKTLLLAGLAALIGLFLGSFLANWLVTALRPPEFRNWVARHQQPARIVNFMGDDPSKPDKNDKMIIRFFNPEFAAQFIAKNNGVVLDQ
jgi:hypothetical protein